jgi:uncharacterized protein (DUF952 family)
VSDPPSPIAFHLTPEEAWHATPAAEPFRAASLETEGFIHLTHRVDDLVAVANQFYRAEPGDHVVLTIVLDRLTSPWRHDGDERFPHVYGPIDRAAIRAVTPIARAADGTYPGFEPTEPDDD